MGDAVAEHLRLAKRLEAAERQIARLEIQVKKLAKPAKPQSAASISGGK
jgi:hypothetical protein